MNSCEARRPKPASARELGIELLDRINACAHVNPINLIALVTLATPKQSIDEARLLEQLDCLAGLLRANTPFSDITVTGMIGAQMIDHAEKLGMIVRESFPLGDVLGHDADNAVLMTWYRNNACHAFALPSLIACLLTNRRRRIDRTQLLEMIATVYPYLKSELYLRDSDTLDIDVGHWLDHLHAQGLVRRSDDEIGPPPPESEASYRFALLAQIVMPMLERFFIAVGLLQQAGQRRIDRRYAGTRLHRHGTAHLAPLRLECAGVFRRPAVPQLRRHADRARCRSPSATTARLGYGPVHRRGDARIERRTDGGVPLGGAARTHTDARCSSDRSADAEPR